MHASTIEGGHELSKAIRLNAVLGLERRTLPGESREDVERELAALLEACRAADPELEATQHTLLVREPFEIERDAEIVELAVSAATGVLGRPPAIGGASFWADSAFIATAGIPTCCSDPAARAPTPSRSG